MSEPDADTSVHEQSHPDTVPIRVVPAPSNDTGGVSLGKASGAAGPPTTPFPTIGAGPTTGSQQPVPTAHPTPTVQPIPTTQPVHWTGGATGGWSAPSQVVTDQRQVSGAVIAIAWVCTLVTMGYLLPWAIAASRGRSNQAAIGLLNLFLGWSFIGWVVSLVMACQAHAVRMVAPVNVMLATQVVTHPAAAPGWYPSPAGYGQEYWDGRVWTGHRAP